MSIQNINTIQNHDDLTYILNNANEYMYESLSNLGQRYSLEGDGITNHSFTIKSLLSYTPNNDDYNLIAKLVVINEKLILELYNISNNSELVYSEEIKYTVNNAIFTDTNIRLNKKINGIDYYNENMLIYINNSNNTLNIASIGCDADLGIIEMNIESYDIQHNILLESLKLININSDKYYLYYLSIDKDNIEYYLNSNISPKYFLKISKIDINFINKLYTDFSHFILYIYNNIVLEYYKEFKETGLIINDIYYEIIQIGFTEKHNNDTNIFEVSLDDNQQEGFYSISPDITVIDNNVLHYMYNQYVHMYSFIFEYYCNYIYKLDSKQLNRYLIYSLYLEIFKKSEKKLLNGFGIYLPLNYTIDYFCKNNDPFYIYSNETPINVLFTNKNLTFDYVKNFFGFVDNEVENNKIILASSNTFETIILYKFSITYNNKFEDIINNIVVSELYSTPYILDDYWVINGIKSVYKAIGKDAGNPNIIIVYTKNLDNKVSNFEPNIDYEVLSSINTEMLNTTIWEKQTVNIELQQKINNDVDEIFSHNFLLPTNIPEKYNEVYENALIINLSSIHNINNTSLSYKIENIKNYLGENSFVTTFWVYKNGKFNCIYKPTNNNVALTMLDISNVENIVSSTIDKQIKLKSDIDNYTFNKITLKSSYTSTKNDFDTISNYLISLKNYTANEQLNNISINDIYNNNLMLKLTADIITDNNLIPSKYLSQYLLNMNTGLYYPENKVYNTDISEYKSCLPKNDFPILNLSNYIVTNANNVNRINLLTFPNTDGTPYYSYIGIGNDKLNELHIGSKSKPLSLITLADEDKLENLSVQDTLSFDFEKIKFNASYILNNINYTYSYNYKNDADEDIRISDNISTYMLNFNIPVYDIITDENAVHISLSYGILYNTGNILLSKPIVKLKTYTYTYTYDNDNNTYNDINYIVIRQSYISKLIANELNIKEQPTYTYISENVNRIGGLNQDDTNIDNYYYIVPYNPITYLVEFTVNANLYLNKFNIHFNGGKLLPFEIKEDKQD